MTTPDPDAQRLRWVEREAGVYDDDENDEEEYSSIGEPDGFSWWDER